MAQDKAFLRDLAEGHGALKKDLASKDTYGKKGAGRAFSKPIAYFLAEFGFHESIPNYLRSPTFHPFTGPRSGWTAAVERQRLLLVKLSEEIDYHSRVSKEYARAYASPWAPVPSETR